MNGGKPPEIEREVEGAPLAVEVLVELSPGDVDRPRRAQHARTRDPCEAVELGVRVALERDRGEALSGGRDEERADGRLDDVEADVDEVERHRGVAEAAVEVG